MIRLGDNVIAAIHQGEHRGGDRRHAGGREQRRFRSFQRRQHRLCLTQRGIAIAGVKLIVPRRVRALGKILSGEAAKSGRLIDGRRHRSARVQMPRGMDCQRLFRQILEIFRFLIRAHDLTSR